jgi:hypothetical protein
MKTESFTCCVLATFYKSDDPFFKFGFCCHKKSKCWDPSSGMASSFLLGMCHMF